VINGKTYYYALDPYDRGFLEMDEDSNFVTDVNGQVRGISPSTASAVIKNDVAGNISVDVNTGVATPRAPAAGYIAPQVEVATRVITGTGTIGVDVLSPTTIQSDKNYTLSFVNDSTWQTNINPLARLTTPGQVTPLFEESLDEGTVQIPYIDGFAINIEGPKSITVDPESIQLIGEGGTHIPVVEPASSSSLFASRFVPFPADFAIHFTDQVSDTSMRVAFGMQEIPTNFYIENTTIGEQVDFSIIEDVDDKRNGVYDHGELIVIIMGTTPENEPVFAGGEWRASWAIRLLEPDPILQPGVDTVPPSAGSSLEFKTHKPFQNSDVYEFTMQGGEFDAQEAKKELNDIYVVPNPYVATSDFEPQNTYRSGRGERRIFFMNLPPKCTIRVYTINGELVKTLQHDEGIDNGQEVWDLTTKDGMNLAYGIYLFHVEAEGVGTQTGRFAVIK
jgi:hypothetical protein